MEKKKIGRPTILIGGSKMHAIRLQIKTLSAIRAESKRTGIPMSELERRALYDRFCAPIKMS